MSNMKSDLVFERYQVDKISYEFNNNYKDNGQPIEIQYDINVEISLNEADTMEYMVTLGCIAFKDAADHNYPFMVDVVLSGFFNCRNINKDTIPSLIQLNAVAILLPYLRATISTVTSLTGQTALNIPLINVQKLYENINTKGNEVKEVEHINPAE